MKIENQMARESEARGIEVKDCGNGHFQIMGLVMVNYYPNSKRQSAYISGTTKAVQWVSVEQAFELSQKLPSGLPVAKRKQSYRRAKSKMLKKHNRCHWCDCKLSANTATIDHVVPLSRGGLDHHNNRVLACYQCNQERGNSMPEAFSDWEGRKLDQEYNQIVGH